MKNWQILTLLCCSLQLCSFTATIFHSRVFVDVDSCNTRSICRKDNIVVCIMWIFCLVICIRSTCNLPEIGKLLCEKLF